MIQHGTQYFIKLPPVNGRQTKRIIHASFISIYFEPILPGRTQDYNLLNKMKMLRKYQRASG